MTERDALVERMARAMIAYDSGPEGSALFNIHNKEFGDAYRQSAAIALDIAMEEAARVVTEHYQELSTEHRLLLVNRAAALRAYISKP